MMKDIQADLEMLVGYLSTGNMVAPVEDTALSDSDKARTRKGKVEQHDPAAYEYSALSPQALSEEDAVAAAFTEKAQQGWEFFHQIVGADGVLFTLFRRIKA